MHIYDSMGETFALGRKLAQGGEASIYRVQGYGDILAKIYTRPRRGYENKLIWMRNHPPDDPSEEIGHASIAWPEELLYTQEGDFLGYFMPFIENAVLLLKVFNPRLRARTFPNFNDLYFHRTARNLSAALGALHERDYVVGDLNESNVMVTPETLVTMIDTDSFQVKARGRFGQTIVHHCPVGKVEYTPPELQGKSLNHVRRQPEQDRFALAVLVFQVLLDGIHPFKAQWLGAGEAPSLESRIKRGWFPYDESQSFPLSSPVNALSLDLLNPVLFDLVFRCFVDGHHKPGLRPTPEEWEYALSEAERALKPCGFGHYYSGHLRGCPRCERLETLSQGTSTAKSSPQSRSPVSQNPRVRIGIPRSGSRQVKKTHPYPQSPSYRSAGFRSHFLLSFPRPKRLTDYFQIFGQLSYALVQGVLGQISIMTLIGGALLGLGLGFLFDGESIGMAIGGVGGLLSGALLSETIHKRIGWEPFMGATGAILTASALWLNGGTIFLALVGGLLGGGFGILAGKLGTQGTWVILWGIGGALSFGYAGRVIGGYVEEAWLGGIISGAATGLLSGAVYQLWDQFGR